MLRKIITGFALLLLTVIAVTQSIDFYSAHFSDDTEQFVIASLGIHKDAGPGALYQMAARDHGNTSEFKCASHALGSPCGYVSYLDLSGQERTIYVSTSESCFQESVIAEQLPLSCRN